ncbi:hypothetical protein BpHYR1_013189 [Brachionus plicatilis]|uniref:Uncharacterized protein n=1 Tax=Brachionus plicatilis TaxID=10195 RepID=A0A3M7QU45_BRAPC|nr:hypothetical protein BpHYR1_013189 [Brachionus plicatilis]
MSTGKGDKSLLFYLLGFKRTAYFLLFQKLTGVQNNNKEFSKSLTIVACVISKEKPSLKRQFTNLNLSLLKKIKNIEYLLTFSHPYRKEKLKIGNIITNLLINQALSLQQRGRSNTDAPKRIWRFLQKIFSYLSNPLFFSTYQFQLKITIFEQTLKNHFKTISNHERFQKLRGYFSLMNILVHDSNEFKQNSNNREFEL